MPFSLPGGAQIAARLAECLADPHRYFQAYQQLIGLGAEASGPARAGLRHENPLVRMHCLRTRRHDLSQEGGPPSVSHD